jgi:uncharacterized membrane protein ArfC
MNHVHWWLFGLSLVMGFGFTFALMFRAAQRQAAEGKPTRVSGVRPVPPTMAGPTAKEPPTTKIRTAKEPRTKNISVVKDTATTRILVTKEAPTTKIPVAEETTKIPCEISSAEETTKIPVADATSKIKVAAYAPFGPGSARADAEGNGPSGWLVKGRSDTRLYYTPDDPSYDQTVAQVWFRDEKAAAKALFTPWRKSSRK